MSYSIIQQDNDISYNVVQLEVNTKADLLELSTQWSSGSTVLCLEDSSVYMLSVADAAGKKEWKEI